MSIFLDQFDNIPTVIQGFTIALLAILIPLAIAILQDIYQREKKRKDADAEYVDLDLHVALDHVFRIKWVLLALGLVFSPMLFWSVSAGILRWLLLVVSCLGMLVVLWSLLRIYTWVKRNPDSFRFHYLKKLHSRKDLPGVWRSVWQVKSIDILSEMEFFRIFSTIVDRLMGEIQEKCDLVTTLLFDFTNSLQHRSTALLAESDEGMFKILEWYYAVLKEEHIRPIKGARGVARRPYYRITVGLELAIKKAIELAMQSRDIEVSQFFSHLRKHVSLHENEHVGKDTEKTYYVKRLLSLFYSVFFETVADSPKRYDWESDFPKEWQITVDRLKTSKLSEMSFEAYWNWASPRIRDPEVDSDKKLAYVTSRIFPNVATRPWAILLILTQPPRGESKVQSVIERPRNFGLPDAPLSYSEEIGQPHMTETFELARMLFPKIFSKTNLETFIQEIEGLQYAPSSREEQNRSILLNVLKQMLAYLNRGEMGYRGPDKTEPHGTAAEHS